MYIVRKTNLVSINPDQLPSSAFCTERSGGTRDQTNVQHSHMHTHTCTLTHAHSHSNTHTYTLTHAHTLKHSHMHTHTCTHTRTLTHAHSHMHIHTCTLTLKHSHMHTHNNHAHTCTLTPMHITPAHSHTHTLTHAHSQQPCTPSFEDAISFARKNQFDGFLAVGGGSVMDTAKVANLLSCCPENELLDFTNAPVGKGQPVTKPLKPLICSK